MAFIYGTTSHENRIETGFLLTTEQYCMPRYPACRWTTVLGSIALLFVAIRTVPAQERVRVRAQALAQERAQEGAQERAQERAQVRAPGTVAIVIETPAGNIEVALDSARAPRTVANFLRYVDGGHFENGQFHRTVTPDNQPQDSVRIEVIQGSTRRVPRDSGFAAIALEPTSETGLRHMDGTISMARAGANTATSSFFIVIGKQPSLDAGGLRQKDGLGFAAFGNVTRGMEYVRGIQQSPHTNQNLTPAIPILRVRRAKP